MPTCFKTKIVIKLKKNLLFQVKKNDQMPQNICTLCADKINDFYEYREMCTATNIQTRKLLGLPEISKFSNTAGRKRKKDVCTFIFFFFVWVFKYLICNI